MVQGLFRVLQLLFGPRRDNTLAGSSTPARGFPMRRFLLVVAALFLLVVARGAITSSSANRLLWSRRRDLRISATASQPRTSSMTWPIPTR